MSKEKVFISYRRKASLFLAQYIYSELTERGYDVFFDMKSINAGNFSDIILTQIAARGYFIVLLAPETMPRLENKDDWVRKEIEYALEKKRVIIPIVHSGFKFSADGKLLTGKLEAVKNYNAITVHDDDIDGAIEKLATRFLSEPINFEVEEVSEAVEKETAARMASAKKFTKPDLNQIKAQTLLNQAINTGFFSKNKAIDLYTQAIDLYPEFAWAYNNRGYMKYKKEDYDGAFEDLNKAIELNLDEPEPYLNLSRIYLDLEDWDSAIEASNSAMEVDPENDWAYNNRGMAYYKKGDQEQAEKDLNKAVELNPANIKAAFNLGWIEGGE